MTAKFKQGDRVKRTGPHSAIWDGNYDPNGPEQFRESEMGDMGTVDRHREGVWVDWDKGGRSVIAAGALTLVTDEAEKTRKAPAFEAGMRVRAIRDTLTLGVRQILKGEEFKVTAFDSKAPPTPFIMRVEPVSREWPSRDGHSASAGARSVNPEDFEEVKTPTLDDFQVGDIVDAHRGARGFPEEYGWAIGNKVAGFAHGRVQTRDRDGNPRGFYPEVLTLVERPEKAETTTESVEVRGMSQFKVGDVVTEEGGYGAPVKVDREVPVAKEPEGPQPGTFGTAIVNGERRHGALDEDGDFVYSYWVEGEHYLATDRLALKGNFEDFQPYDA